MKTAEEFLKKNNVREDIVIKSTIPGVCVSTFKLVDLLTAYATQKAIPVDWEKLREEIVDIIYDNVEWFNDDTAPFIHGDKSGKDIISRIKSKLTQ